MKLPGVNVRPIGNFRQGQIQQPNYARRGQAASSLVRAAGEIATETYLRNVDTELTSAMGDAAQELSELRAKLELSNAIPTDEIPDDIIHEIGTTIVDYKGDERDIGRPTVFTHEVADEWWDLQSDKIVRNHASRIRSKKAREKFVLEMTERYVAPASLAIAKASVQRSKSHNQASATIAIQEVLSSNAPTAERETQAREILSRQLALGADPAWVANQLAGIGPMIDQIDFQNEVLKATDPGQLQAIEERMWGEGNRMSADQMRTISSQINQRNNEFEQARVRRHQEGGAELTSMLFNEQLSLGTVDQYLRSDRVDRPTAMVLRNALKEGGTTNVSNPAALSNWRNEIIKLPYTGAKERVTAKAAFMKRKVQMAAMGLNPNGTPSINGPTLSGTDAQTILEEIDQQVKRALETPAYDNAWQMIKSASGITDAFGVLSGNQANKNAAIAFKQALDAYMDQYGADADPVGFFNQNRAAFDPDKYDDPVNREFADFYPAAKRFMEIEGTEYRFNQTRQQEFIKWLTKAASTGEIGEAEADAVAAQFLAFYRGQGIAPNGGELSLEPDHPLYRQFEQ